jgi:hypothetical protein
MNRHRGMHRTERGSAGSNSTKNVLVNVDPALPRSVLCIPIFLFISLASLTVSACRQDAERGRVPSEVQEVVTSVGENIAQERYEQIYSESSDLWKNDVTLDQSNEVFKTLQTKLGKVESRALHSAAEQQNSGGVLKGHVYILSYQTRFERGDGMETFTLIEENGRWRLARYFVNSTALQ